MKNKEFWKFKLLLSLWFKSITIVVRMCSDARLPNPHAHIAFAQVGVWAYQRKLVKHIKENIDQIF